MSVTRMTTTPPIRAWAVAYPSTPDRLPALALDRYRAETIAANTGGVISEVHNLESILVMNHIHPDPTCACMGGLEHIGLCLTTAAETALATIRLGHLVHVDGDPAGTWWLDCTHLLDDTLFDVASIARQRRHIAIATFARWVEVHPTRLHHYRIPTTVQPAAGPTAGAEVAA